MQRFIFSFFSRRIIFYQFVVVVVVVAIAIVVIWFINFLSKEVFPVTKSEQFSKKVLDINEEKFVVQCSINWN